MAKKTVDDDREPVVDRFPTPELLASLTPELKTLVDSGIVTLKNDAIEWRMGHLLHIANLYKSDPAKTERDYADDLAVARAYSADVWEALLK